jgi:hypothetical protein
MAISTRSRFAFLALTLAAAWAASAAEPLKLTDASYMDIDSMVLAAKGRPNEEQRLYGLKAYVQGRYGEADERFRHAAQYADKYSQHYLSLMRWHGVGGAPDRVQGYIWADLAAERGSRRLLAIREKMWAELTPEQRTQVEAQGGDYYARYGDDIAKPRAESQIRSFARDMTGSRVGYRNQAMNISGAPVNGAFAVDTGSNAAAYAIAAAATPDELYGKEGGLQRLNAYWKEQDRQLDLGTVEVGTPRKVRGQRDP